MLLFFTLNVSTNGLRRKPLGVHLQRYKLFWITEKKYRKKIKRRANYTKNDTKERTVSDALPYLDNLRESFISRQPCGH